MTKMKNYWGVVLIALTVLISSCVKDEVIENAYASYGYAEVSENGDAVTVYLESGTVLIFNEESVVAFGDDITDGQRILVNYEQDERIDEVTITIKVIALADVEEKDLLYIPSTDTTTVFTSNYMEFNSANITNGLLNVQVAYVVNHEEHDTKLVYKASMQEEGENVTLVLFNAVEGEELEDYKSGYDIITFDVTELAAIHSPDQDGMILFDIIYNPSSIYEEKITGFQYKVYDVD